MRPLVYLLIHNYNGTVGSPDKFYRCVAKYKVLSFRYFGASHNNIIEISRCDVFGSDNLSFLPNRCCEFYSHTCVNI